MAAGGSQIRCRRFGSAEAQSWVFAGSQQVPWQELVLFGILAGGWAGEMVLVSAFVPRQAELCRPGLNNSPSHRLPAFPLSEQSCSLTTFQVLSPACHQNTLLLAPPLLPARLGASAWPVGCPSVLVPPASPVERTASPPFLPSSVGLSSALGSGESILLVFWKFSGLFRQV